MPIKDVGPSHSVALALAIIMQDTGCAGDVASDRLRALARTQARTPDDMAERIVAAGTSIEPTAAPEAAAAVNDPALVRLAQQAITVLMWENAVDADEAAQLIRDRAEHNRLTIAELVEAIVAVAAGPSV